MCAFRPVRVRKVDTTKTYSVASIRLTAGLLQSGKIKSKTLMINSSLNIGANISDIYSSRITLFLI